MTQETKKIICELAQETKIAVPELAQETKKALPEVTQEMYYLYRLRKLEVKKC